MAHAQALCAGHANGITAAVIGKNEKMEILYNYLSGSEFRNHIQDIVEEFTLMYDDLNKEKRSMEALWKKREKQIQSVLSNTHQLYGSIKGIAGKAIAPIRALELPENSN